jgi:hypothetical protein
MNTTFRNSLIATLLALWSQLCLAGSLPDTTKQEINHLFSYLKSSGCSFNRNGTWYSAGDAADHLQQKYDYLLKKDMITDAESFIKLAATESSMSGKAYEVKCGDAAPIASGTWFSHELATYRQHALTKGDI